jgi:hypothetical protein
VDELELLQNGVLEPGREGDPCRTRRSIGEARVRPMCRSRFARSAADGAAGSMMRSTKNRYALSVGTRPADVCGWKRYPFSSRSLMVLRTVAADTPSSYERDTLRLPAGSAVST